MSAAVAIKQVYRIDGFAREDYSGVLPPGPRAPSQRESGVALQVEYAKAVLRTGSAYSMRCPTVEDPLHLEYFKVLSMSAANWKVASSVGGWGENGNNWMWC